MTSWYSDCQRPDCPRLLGFAWVRKCMCVVLNQTKNGFLLLFALVMKSFAAARNSSSTVCIRFFVSGPVFSIFCFPLGRAQQWSTPRGAKFFLKLGKSFSGG